MGIEYEISWKQFSEVKLYDSLLNYNGVLENPSESQSKHHDEITCIELFKLINSNIKNERVLIFDVRKDEDFLKSRMVFQKNTIHIPADKIEPK